MSDERIDLTSEPAQPPASDDGRSRFVGVQFSCCSTYARIYLNRERTAYAGNCPRCAKPVRLRIGPGGSDSRFFTAY